MPRQKTVTTIGAVPLKSEQIQEIIKCGSNAAYFISKYVKITHPLRGPIPFHTFPYQDRCLKAFQENRFVITNKSRQLGLSTLSAAYSLYLALFQREKNILIIATKLEIAKNFIKKVSGMYDSLPKWLVMPQIRARSVRYLEFSNGSKIQAIPTGVDAGRSEALSLLILDEAAHIEGIDDLWLGLRPTLATGGNCIMISSPSGVGTLFHKLWVGASKGENGDGGNFPGNGTNEFYRIELPWQVHPERDQEWYEKEAAEIRPAKGERGVLQELSCIFGASGESFLPLEVMEQLDKNVLTPIANFGLRGDTWIWKYPVEGHKYILSLDISRGDAEDFSTFNVIDIMADEVVCEYQGKITPEELATLAMDVGKKYNTAMICPELNSFGLLTAKELKKAKYPNLYYEKYTKGAFAIYSDIDLIDEMPGFTTGQKNREEIIANLENRLRSGKIRIYSSRLVDELKTFVWKSNRRAEAMRGYFDDILMSLAIGLSLYEAAGINVWDSVENSAAMLAGISVGVKKMNAIGGTFGNETKFIPPVLTSNNLKEYTQAQNLQVKQEQKQQGPQNFQNSWWRNFKWVLDD